MKIKIDTKLLPFNIETNVLKNNIWHTSSQQEKQNFIFAASAFANIYKTYIAKYENKDTYKGHFIASTLENFYQDMLGTPTTQENIGGINFFDARLNDCDNNLEDYSNELLKQSVSINKHIETLNRAYENEKRKIHYIIDNRNYGEHFQDALDLLTKTTYEKLLFE